MDATDRFLGGSLSRRAFLARLGLVAGGAAVALACGAEATAIAPTRPPSPTPEPTAEEAAPAPTSEDAIDSGPVEFEADGDTLLGYLSRPTLPGPHPAIVVVHENRGLLPHFEDVTRRFAREGYVALAVDMLSREGGADSFADANEMLAALRRIPTEQIVGDGNAAARFLQEHPDTRALPWSVLWNDR